MADGEADLRLVADCGGLIREIAICVPPQLLVAEPDARRAGMLAALAALAESLPEGVTLIVLAEKQGAKPARDWLTGLDLTCRPSIAATAEDGAMTLRDIWIQDSVVVAETADGARRYLRTRSDNRGGHAAWLGRHDGAPVLNDPVRLTGGNLLVDRDGSMLLGRDAKGLPASVRAGTTRRFGYRLSENSGRATRRVERERASDPLVQPGVHVDLVASVTGLEQDGRPILLVADPKQGTDPDGPAYRFMSGPLDACARTLAEDGCAVTRNPVPYAPLSGSAELRPRLYNNLLVENQTRPGRTRPLVWMPCFGDAEPALRAFDAANAALWRSLGFDVVEVPGWGLFAPANGGMRCASKVLRRDRA